MVEPSASTAHPSLAGVRVVELGSSVAAPYAAWILASLGADVVKVEPPGRGDDCRQWGKATPDGSSSYFHAMNRDKRGITVDLTDRAEAHWLRSYIVAKADVVLQNRRPGRAEALGFGSASLIHAKPELIYCNLWAFGATGPLKDDPGYDPLMQAYGGIMSVTGHPGDAPVRVGTSIVDMGTGMWCAIGILAALNARRDTAKGCVIDASLYETSVAWLANAVASTSADGTAPEKQGSGARGMAPYQAYACSDGYLVVAAPNDRMFARLAGVLGHPEWPKDPRFAANMDRFANLNALNALIEPILATQPRAHWQAELHAAGVPTAPVQSVPEMMADPQTRALGILQQLPGGLELMGMPLSFDGQRPALRRYAPALGADNDDIKGGTA
ncbi:MAG: CoA transferase [Rhodospirillaceae bacterium]